MVPCDGLGLIVHLDPRNIAAEIAIADLPERRTAGAIRRVYRVRNIETSRALATSFGGGIDASPAACAEPNTPFFFGYGPEGTQFEVKPAR